MAGTRPRRDWGTSSSGGCGGSGGSPGRAPPWTAASASSFPRPPANGGLGTGRPDLGAFAALNRRWDRLQASLLAGWIQSPSAPEATRTGIPVAGLGLSWYAARGKYSMAYQARGAAEEGTPAPRELAVDIYQALSLRTALKATYVAGLSDGTAKSSFGLGLVFYP